MRVRLEYIDQLKGIAILLVVVGHFIQYNTTESTSNNLFSAIYSFHMPLFMFLSGYIAVKTISTEIFRNYTAFIRKKTIALLLPFFSWYLLVNHLFFTKFDESFSFSLIYKLVENPTIGLWFLWYLFFLTVLYSAHLFISNWFSKVPNFASDIIIMVVLLAFVVIIHLTNFVNYSDAFIQYFGFYFIGVFISKYHFLENLILDKRIFSTFFIIFILTCGQFSFDDPNFHHLNMMLALKVLISVSAICTIYYLARNMTWHPIISKYVTFWGGNSLIIYATHSKIIYIVPQSNLISKQSLFVIFIISLFFSVLVITTSIAISRIFSLCPPLALFLYGKSSKSKATL